MKIGFAGLHTVQLRNGEFVLVPDRGVTVVCGMCGRTWRGGRGRRSCPVCGAFVNQQVVA